MKVAIIITRYYPFIGGAEVFAQEFAEYLVKRGWEVDVITMCPDRSLNKLEKINNVMVHRIKVGRIKYLSFLISYIRLLWYILKLNKAKNYDLIHAVSDGLPSIIAITIKKLKRKSSIITIQGGNISAGFENSLSGRLLRKLQKWSFRNADLVHVISQSLAKGAKKLGAENIVVIPNGVDNQFFKPIDKEQLRKRHDFSTEENIVISVARLNPVKGIDCLIKAVALVVEKITNLRLIVVGDGEQREELEGLIAQLHLDPNVQLLGFLPRRQIPEYLNLADVFVLPSRHEGLGIALIEAMACGVPVIGSNVDGIVDIIDSGKNGILVPPDNEKALAEGIERLLCDKNLRDKFIKEGLRKVEEKFLWDSILRQIEEIYISLAKNKDMKGSR